MARPKQFNHNQHHHYVRYARMSSDLQNPRSPDQQFDEIDRVLRRAGHPWTALKDYRDNGISGRLTAGRPAFQQMLADIKSEMVRATVILVDTLERFSRSEDASRIRDELWRNFRVVVLTADSQFTNPTNSAGKALSAFESIRATSAYDERAHNVRRGKMDCVKLGFWPGGPTPLGTKLKESTVPDGRGGTIKGNKLMLNREDSWLVQDHKQRYVDTGWGTTKLARYYNAQPDLVARFGRFHAHFHWQSAG